MWKRSNLRRGKLTLAFLALIVVGLYGLAWGTYDMHTHNGCWHYGTITTNPTITSTSTHTLRAQCNSGSGYWVDAGVHNPDYSYALGPAHPTGGTCVTKTGSLSSSVSYSFVSTCTGTGGWAVLTNTTPPNCYGDGPGGE